MNMFRRLSEAPRRASGAKGFTLLELMVVITILIIGVTVGFPTLSKMIHRERLLAFVRGASLELARARQEAIRRHTPVVVEPRLAEHRLHVFVNTDLDDDAEFDPAAGDESIDSWALPTESPVYFHGPADKNPDGPDAIDGLTARPSGGENVFVFDPDGSIRDVGAVRVADTIGNFIEVRVSPQATGRIVLRKWDENASKFYEQGHDPNTGENLWKW